MSSNTLLPWGRSFMNGNLLEVNRSLIYFKILSKLYYLSLTQLMLACCWVYLTSVILVSLSEIETSSDIVHSRSASVFELFQLKNYIRKYDPLQMPQGSPDVWVITTFLEVHVWYNKSLLYVLLSNVFWNVQDWRTPW